MDWSLATPALIQAGCGLLLVMLSGGFYLIGQRKEAADEEGSSTGCVAFILLVVGAVALWQGLENFDAVIQRQ